jgi:hypothetical protein
MIKPSFWSQLGPVLLLGAFLNPTSLLAWTALAGYFTILLWKKGGFYLSITALIAAGIFSGGDPWWRLLLSSSIAVSWLLILLGQLEGDAFFSSCNEEKNGLDEQRIALEKELKMLKHSIAEENRKNIVEKERLNQLNVQAMRELAQSKLYLEVAEKERDTLQAKYSALQTPAVIPQEDEDPQEKMQLEQAQRQYALLREQFDEKSEALDKARKELFRTENELMVMQKAQEEASFEFSDEDRSLLNDLQRLEEECSDLETQVVNLQEFISTLLAPKKRPPVRTRKSAETEQRLPLLIQAKIDQSSLSDSDRSIIS